MHTFNIEFTNRSNLIITADYYATKYGVTTFYKKIEGEVYGTPIASVNTEFMISITREPNNEDT